jgi:hypothetical protein
MKSYWEEAEEAQISKGDELKSALAGGAQAYMTSKMLGGDKASGGIFRKMGQEGFFPALKTAGKELISGKGGGIEGMKEATMLPMLLMQLLDKGWED